MNPRLVVFQKEFDTMQNQDIIEFTKTMLSRVPEKFWTAAASSTGKYHPATSNIVGGLVVHTKQVFWIAHAMLDTGQFRVMNNDIVLAACLLHDSWKYEFNHSQYTHRTHAILAVNKMIETIAELDYFHGKDIPEWCEMILAAVLSHNGRYTGEWNQKQPMTPTQKIVHLSDWLASRKFLPFDEKLTPGNK